MTRARLPVLTVPPARKSSVAAGGLQLTRRPFWLQGRVLPPSVQVPVMPQLDVGSQKNIESLDPAVKSAVPSLYAEPLRTAVRAPAVPDPGAAAGGLAGRKAIRGRAIWRTIVTSWLV